MNVEQEIRDMQDAQRKADDNHRLVLGRLKGLDTYLHERFRRTDANFEEVNGKIDLLSDTMDRRFDDIARRLDEADTNLGNLYHATAKGFEQVRADAAETNRALAALDVTVNAKLDAILDILRKR